jgi:hypothetical protein
MCHKYMLRAILPRVNLHRPNQLRATEVTSLGLNSREEFIMSYLTMRHLLRAASELDGAWESFVVGWETPLPRDPAVMQQLFPGDSYNNLLVQRASRRGWSLRQALTNRVDVREAGIAGENGLLEFKEIVLKGFWGDNVYYHSYREWSRDPMVWLDHAVYEANTSLMDLVLRAIASGGRDMLAQYEASCDRLMIHDANLRGWWLENQPLDPLTCAGSQEKEGMGVRVDHWLGGRSRERWEVNHGKPFPAHRKGKTPRGKTLADKRRGVA